MIARHHLLSAGVLMGLCVSRPAAADFDKYQCVEANTSAQSLVHEGKFAAARTQFNICADASCPEVVRTDCLQRQEDLERRQPTIVFDIKDEGRHDVAEVAILVDGQRVADRSAGLAVAVDPGPHRFSFETPGHPPTTADFVIHDGERQRTEHIVLLEAPGETSPLPPALPPSSEQTASGQNQRLAAAGLGGGGVGGVVVGSIDGLLASSALSKSRRDCGSPSSCPDHPDAVTDYQTASTYGTVSTTAFIAGGVLLAAAATLFFTAPSRATRDRPAKTPRAARSLLVVPGADAHAAALLVRGEF